MLRLPPQKERHPLRLEISIEQQVTPVQDDPVNEGQEEGSSTCGLPNGDYSPTKPLMTVDFPAPFVLTTATRLTCDTVRFTSTIVGLSFEGYWKSTLIMRKFAALHVLKETRLHEGELHQPVAKYALSPGTSHEHGEHVAREGLEPVLQPPDVIHVQVTSGLNTHEHTAVEQLSRAQLHLHLPAATVTRHGQLQFRRAVRAACVFEASAPN